MKTGVELIAEERQEQIEKHGFDETNDKHYKSEELKRAAVFVLTGDDEWYPRTWSSWFGVKMDSKTDPIERLKIAGALIAAEIDRLQNK